VATPVSLLVIVTVAPEPRTARVRDLPSISPRRLAQKKEGSNAEKRNNKIAQLENLRIFIHDL